MRLIVPPKVDLFSIEHTVDYEKSAVTERARWGEYLYGTRRIVLYEGMAVPEEVLFHEVAEGIATLLELKVNGKTLPHNIINAFGLGFYNFIVSNLERLVEK